MLQYRRRHVFWGAFAGIFLITPLLSGQSQKPGPTSPVGIPQGAIPALVHGLAEDSQRLAELSRSELAKSPYGPQINARVSVLRTVAEQLDRQVKQRDQNIPRRQQAVRDLRRAYQPVFEALTQPRLNAPGSQRISERIGQNISALEIVLGIPVKPPVPETPLEVRLQRALVREYSALLAETDTFMAGLNDKVPEGPQIRTEALALRDAVRRLRGFTAKGAPDRRIIQELASAVAAQRTVQARVDRVNMGRAPGPNVLRLRRIGDVLARIQNGPGADPRSPQLPRP